MTGVTFNTNSAWDRKNAINHNGRTYEREYNVWGPILYDVYLLMSNWAIGNAEIFQQLEASTKAL